MIFTPHQYQLDAAKFHYAHPYSALYADPGTGKTATMLMLLSVLKKEGKLSPTLITAPLRVATTVWPAEIAQWDQFRGLTFQVLHGSGKAARADKRADIHIINNEGLQWAEKAGILDRYKTLIIDESSKFKNWTSQRTNLLKRRVHKFERRHVLTGSPAPRSLMDVFAQQFLADGGRTLGKYISGFRHKYFNSLQIQLDACRAFTKWDLKPGADKEIYEAIAPFCYRLDAKQLLPLPRLVTQDVPVHLPKKILELSFEALDRLGANVTLSAANDYALARQVASGFVAASHRVIHEIKVKALEDLVAELQGKPALVFFYYQAEGKFLSERFGAPRIDGTVSPVVSNSLMEKWNKGELPLLFMQPAATGHGLNLQRGGNHIIWFSYTDNQDDYYQANRRVYRQGVNGDVFVHRLISIGTIDEAMIKSLEAKADQQQALLDAIRELRGRNYGNQ